MNIGIVTGSRAEWGLLYPLAKAVWMSSDKLNLFVTGSHLSNAHGHTVDEIRLPITAEIQCVLASDDEKSICKNVSLAVAGFGDVFDDCTLDCVILLGDRYEILAAAISAHIHRIPIVHIHGGEVTAGAYDDAFRHSITKMSSLHFVANGEYRRRVIQLGERPETVFNVGALGVTGLSPRNKQPNSKQAIVLYHPETLMANSTITVYYIVEALIECGVIPIFILSNADNGNNAINSAIKSFPYNVYTSRERDEFIDMLLGADFIIGNSSCGIIEAPALGVPTINVGSRQGGRERASSIIDVFDPTKQDIIEAINRVYSTSFQNKLSNISMPYENSDNADISILSVIRSELENVNLLKGFYDLAS